jgi:hypothetical protein
MLLKLDPKYRYYDDPLTEVAHVRSAVETRLLEARQRQIEQREQEVRLILSTSRLANQQMDQWSETKAALRFVDNVFIVFGAVILGLALGWLVLR